MGQLLLGLSHGLKPHCQLRALFASSLAERLE